MLEVKAFVGYVRGTRTSRAALVPMNDDKFFFESKAIISSECDGGCTWTAVHEEQDGFVLVMSTEIDRLAGATDLDDFERFDSVRCFDPC